MTAEWAQVLIGAVALVWGWKYLSQHKRKVKLERDYRFAEKMIQLLHEMDALMSELFNEKILHSPEWQEEVKKIDELTDVFTLMGYPKFRYFYMRHLAVKANKDAVWVRMMALNRELIMYIGYFEDEKMTIYRRRMIFKAKAIIDWIVVSFSQLMKEDLGNTEESLQYFDKEIESVFPDTMYHQVPLVKDY